jgi:putative hydrolase of the HAD superfamily
MLVEKSVIVFDLGGVLVENSTFDELPKLLKGEVERSALFERWLHSASVRQFERGLIDENVFAANFIDEWALRISPSDFLAQFTTWPKAPYPGALELLSNLKAKYQIGVLSNCNHVHWSRFPEILEQIAHPFSSHILGLVKPDEEIFRGVAGRIGCRAADIHFFDDSESNVDAARVAGWNAHRTQGLTEVISRLQALGCAF